MLDLVHLLTGDDAFPPSLDSMVELYVEKRKFDFEQAAWYAHYLDSERALKLLTLYETLPQHSRLHFLLSPASYEAVDTFTKNNSASDLDALIALCADEVTFVNGTPPHGHRNGQSVIWSPMGDEMLRLTENGHERRVSVRLDSLIVVDFDSVHARTIRPTSPLMFRPPEDFTDDERATVVAKLEGALGYIDEVAPTFGRLIRNYTHAIRLRKCDSVSAYSSEHVTDTIGEIRILNAHKREWGIHKVAETLIHESVHNLLSTYEYVNQPFVLTGDDRRYRPVSTWTGNPIPVPSFCHAVFVWFALFQFAIRELQQSGIGAEQRAEVQRRRNDYASGFIIPTVLSDHLRDLAVYHDSILPAIDAVQELVRSVVDEKSRSHAVADTALLPA